jgi:hypothetical protein
VRGVDSTHRLDVSRSGVDMNFSRYRGMALASVICAFQATSACGGNTDPSKTTSGGTGGSVTTGNVGGAGGSNSSAVNTGGTSASGDLSGTWDVIATPSIGAAMTATVTISPSLLQVIPKPNLMALVSNDTIEISYDGNAARATRTAAPTASLGVMPLQLSGGLHFSGVPDTGVSCDYQLGPASLSFSCTNSVKHLRNWPRLSNVVLLAARDSASTSDFGDLGGHWTVDTGKTTCEAVVAGSAVTLTCANADQYTGQVAMNVNGNRISGTTSGGIEFTAQRR